MKKYLIGLVLLCAIVLDPGLSHAQSVNTSNMGIDQLLALIQQLQAQIDQLNRQAGQLTYTLTPDKTTYAVGEQIGLTLRATNQSNTDRVLNWTTGCQTGYRIRSWQPWMETEQGALTYNSATNTICTQSLTSVRVPAHSTYDWRIIHSPSAYTLPAGDYYFQADLLGYKENAASSAHITVQAAPANSTTNDRLSAVYESGVTSVSLSGPNINGASDIPNLVLVRYPQGYTSDPNQTVAQLLASLPTCINTNNACRVITTFSASGSGAGVSVSAIDRSAVRTFLSGQSFLYNVLRLNSTRDGATGIWSSNTVTIPQRTAAPYLVSLRGSNSNSSAGYIGETITVTGIELAAGDEVRLTHQIAPGTSDAGFYEAYATLMVSNNQFSFVVPSQMRFGGGFAGSYGAPQPIDNNGTSYDLKIVKPDGVTMSNALPFMVTRPATGLPNPSNNVLLSVDIGPWTNGSSLVRGTSNATAVSFHTSQGGSSAATCVWSSSNSSIFTLIPAIGTSVMINAIGEGSANLSVSCTPIAPTTGSTQNAVVSLNVVRPAQVGGGLSIILSAPQENQQIISGQPVTLSWSGYVSGDPGYPINTNTAVDIKYKLSSESTWHTAFPGLTGFMSVNAGTSITQTGNYDLQVCFAGKTDCSPVRHITLVPVSNTLASVSIGPWTNGSTLTAATNNATAVSFSSGQQVSGQMLSAACTWSSSNSSIFTVLPAIGTSIMVNAIAPGTATLTVSCTPIAPTTGSTQTATISLNVVQPAPPTPTLTAFSLQDFEGAGTDDAVRATDSTGAVSGSIGKLIYTPTPSWQNKYVAVNSTDWSKYKYLEFMIYVDPSNPDTGVPQLRLDNVYSGNANGAFNGSAGRYEMRNYGKGRSGWQQVDIDLSQFTSRGPTSSLLFYFYGPWYKNNGTYTFYLDNLKLVNAPTVAAAKSSSYDSQLANIAAALQAIMEGLKTVTR